MSTLARRSLPGLHGAGYGSASRSRFAGLALVVGLHGLALWGALQLEPVRQAVMTIAPVMVSFVAAPKPQVELPKPKPPPPKPKPRIIAAPAETASPIVVEAVPEPEPPPPAAPPAPPAPPAPIIPPNFAAAYLDNPAPAYPSVSKQRHEQGRVLLRVRVSAQGRAETVEVEKGSGYQRLDRAAQEAVRQWRFVPARQGEQTLVAWVLVPIDFELND